MTKLIQFRISKQQYELLLNKKESLGYRALSQMIRDYILKDDLVTIKLIREIHQKVVGGKFNS